MDDQIDLQLPEIPEFTDVLELLDLAEGIEANARKRKSNIWHHPECPKRPYHFHEKKIEEMVENMNDEHFQHVMRMSRECFEILAEMYAPLFPFIGSTNGQSVTPR